MAPGLGVDAPIWYAPGSVSHYVVIHNPVAGHGRARDRMRDAEQLLRRNDVGYELLVTEYPGHAIELARQAALSNRCRAIVAAGGDGTANEVLNGMMQARLTGAAVPALGVLSIGRGNDFAYGAGLPTTIESAVEALVGGSVATIDVGFLRGGVYPDGRYFGNGIGIGFDTIVGFEAAKLKRVRGFAGYLIGALKVLLLYYRAPLLTIRTDDGERAQPCIQVSVMNGRRMGGGFHMAPDARIDDGLLDICIAGSPRRFQMIALFLRYLRGTQSGHPHISICRTGSVSVVSDGAPLAIHADGETISVDGTSLDVCLAGQMQVLRAADASDCRTP